MNRIELAGFLLACVCLTAQAQVRDAAKSVPPPSGKGRISGSVTDERGEPVKRAAIRISGDMRLDRMTMSDDQGRFNLVDLPAGRFSVTASKAGYPQVSYGAKRPFRPGAGVFLEEGEHASDIPLVLARGAVLTGTVYDENGSPLPGVPVMAWEVRTALNGQRTLDYASPEPVTVVTDDQGVYRVFGLAPGVFTLGTTWYYLGNPFDVRTPTEAELRSAFSTTNQPARPTATPSPSPAPNVPRYNYVPVFTPGVLDPLAADTFTLKAGDVRTGVDLRMQFQATSRIEGKIVDPRGLPINVRLGLTRRSPVKALNNTQMRPSQSDGRFTIGGVTPGLYTIFATTQAAGQSAAMWASSDVSLSGGDVADVTLTLQPAGVVTGRVLFEGTELPPPADLTRLSILLADVGPTERGWTSGTVDATGSVTVQGVAPGRFMVRAGIPGGLPPTGPAWTVKSVTVGGRDVTDRGFDLSSGGASDVAITFTSVVSELSGLVTTAAGVPETDYFVIAMPADREYWLPQSRRIMNTRPDGKGRYVFRGLPAGDYRIAVTTDLVARDLQEFSTLEQLAAVSLPVTIATGERKVLNVRTSGQ
jgi:protocatechuate 3,4-dioxygenase beta subunit